MTAKGAPDLRTPAAMLALMSFDGIGLRSALKAAEHGLGSLKKAPDVADLAAAVLRAGDVIAEHEQAGVSVVGYFDDTYPKRLRELTDPPPVLFARGDIAVCDRLPFVAVVGTRKPTLFGESATDMLTRACANAGYGIASGLALGVDGIAHRAALEEGVPTVAVLGGGLDNVTPPEHRALARDIVQCGGLLLSEQPFGVRPTAHTLVARNRMQTGLSVGVVIGQTPLKSGTMYTARFAAHQKRPIFCPVPAKDTRESAGLKVLLERPAFELSQRLPAFRDHGALCRRIGDAPLARAVTRGNIDEMLAAFRN